MKTIVALAVSLLVMITVAACVPIAGPSQIASPASTPQSAATATPQPMRMDVAPLGSGIGTTIDEQNRKVPDETTYRALDRDPDTSWNSQQPAPHWFSVVFEELYVVDQVLAQISQAPAGPTTHDVWLGHGSGLRTFYARFTDAYTEDREILSFTIEPPQAVNEVFILTAESPSWIAWREWKIFGVPQSDPSERIAAPRLNLKPAAVGLKLPVQVTHAGDGSGRIFVLEQEGRIRVIKDGVINELPFLDISERVSCCNEQGLIGLAFPPTYPAQPHFYVGYTNAEGTTTISRFITGDDPDRADPGSEEVLLTIEQPTIMHNGGHMAFGPRDGYLYIGSGDGGKPYDREFSGLQTDTLLGKILRIDVESDAKPYAIPADNPFIEDESYHPEIWALGLRNPWGFAFDPLTGDLFTPDTGDAKREEVNFQPAESRGGENYGWSIVEGTNCYWHESVACSAEGVTFPVAEYSHLRGCAVVGGAVYRGDRIPELQGYFIFADFCIGEIYGVKQLDPQPAQADRPAWQSALLASAAVPISGIGQDEEGNVYAIGYQDGVLYLLAQE